MVVSAPQVSSGAPRLPQERGGRAQRIPANRSFFDRFPSLVAIDAGGRHLVSRLWIRALGSDRAWIAKHPDLKLASGGKARQGFCEKSRFNRTCRARQLLANRLLKTTPLPISEPVKLVDGRVHSLRSQ